MFQFEKWSTDLNRELLTEEYQMDKRHLRKYLASLVIREIKVKITLRYHLTPVRMAKIKNTDDSLCCREYKVKTTFWESLWQFLKQLESIYLKTEQYYSLTFTQRKLNHTPGHLLNYAHRSIICNSQNLETT